MTEFMPTFTGQSGDSDNEPPRVTDNEPLRPIEVRPPESPEQFIGLHEDESPPVELVFNRSLTAYEKYVLLKVRPFSDDFLGAVIGSDGDVVTVNVPFSKWGGAAGLVAKIKSISDVAAATEAHHRKRLHEWQEAGAEINKALQ